MAEEADKAADSAEKAYAAASVEAEQAAMPEVSAKAKMARKEADKRPEAGAAAKSAAQPEKKTSRRKVSSRPAPKHKNAPVEPVRPAPPTIVQLKEKIMASSKSTDFTKSLSDVMSDMQSRAQTAYEKSSEITGEMSEFAKGNVEAMVEAGKLLAAGMQNMGKTYVEDAKSAYETVTGDLKEVAAIKSPSELFQLQGKLARRNFDAMVAFSSKQTETMMKLANESFAPISSRMSVAAEKISKAA